MHYTAPECAGRDYLCGTCNDGIMRTLPEIWRHRDAVHPDLKG